MAETIDQQFVEYLAKALVGEPDKVRIARKIDERGVLLELYVGPEDLGRVIGRNGATAKSIRTLLRALGVKNGARYNLKIVDTNEGGATPEAKSTPVETTEPAKVEKSSAPTEEPTFEPEPSAESEIEAEPVEKIAEEPQPKEDEDKLSRHREDLKDLTDLDI